MTKGPTICRWSNVTVSEQPEALSDVRAGRAGEAGSLIGLASVPVRPASLPGLPSKTQTLDALQGHSTSS